MGSLDTDPEEHRAGKSGQSCGSNWYKTLESSEWDGLGRV